MQYIVQWKVVPLSAIKAYNGYKPCHKVLWINPATNITFSVITPETAGFKPLTPNSWQCCIYPQGTTWRVQPLTWGGLPWLETSPPNTGVEGLNPRGLKCGNQKGYVGRWIYPEYSVAWLIAVVGFDSWQCCIYSQGTTWRVQPRTWGGLPWWRRF